MRKIKINESQRAFSFCTRIFQVLVGYVGQFCAGAFSTFSTFQALSLQLHHQIFRWIFSYVSVGSFLIKNILGRSVHYNMRKSMNADTWPISELWLLTFQMVAAKLVSFHLQPNQATLGWNSFATSLTSLGVDTDLHENTIWNNPWPWINDNWQKDYKKVTNPNLEIV